MTTDVTKKTETEREQRNRARTHHLDRHAERIAADAPYDGSDEVLLTEEEMAAWFRCSKQWLRAARSGGYGPPFERLGPMLIRYVPSKVKVWLRGRSHRSTSEYDNSHSQKAVAGRQAARAARAAR